MHFLRLAAFTALSPLALADSTPASPDSSELIARQIPAPQINVYCISVEAKAYPDVFNSSESSIMTVLSAISDLLQLSKMSATLSPTMLFRRARK